MGRVAREQRFQDQQVQLARQQGILGAKEPVRGTLTLMWRRIPPLWLWWLAIPVFLSVYFQRSYLLVITDRRAVLFRVAAYAFRSKVPPQSAAAPLPQQCRLSKPPKETHQFGDNKVELPEVLARLVGRPFLYTMSGLKAESVLKLASAPAPVMKGEL